MCPVPTANDAKPAPREASAAAIAPKPELVKRLTSAQKTQLQVLGPLCETAVLQSESNKSAVEVGCACCPPFAECGPVPGGLPRGNADGAFPIVTRSEGSFTKAGVRELAVTFDGCEPHAGNYGGTVLYRRLKDGWAVDSYVSGLHPNRCQPYRLREGRDVLICEWSDAHQGVGGTHVFVYDFAAPDRKCWTELADFLDDSLLCEGEPGKPLTWSVLDRVRIQHVDRDGILDLRIEGRERSGLPSARFREVCAKKLERDAAPTPAELAFEHSLLGPLEHLVYDFVSDGTRFRPLSGPAAP